MKLRVILLLLLATMSLTHGDESAAARDLAIIVDKLEQDDPAGAESTKAYLIDPRFYRLLRQHTARIKPRVVSGSKERDLEILALLDTTEADRELIRRSEWPAAYIKARAGDRAAFAQVQRDFMAASEPRQLVLQGLRLLYVGNREAMELFAKRLSSPQTISSREPNPHFVHVHFTADGGQVTHGHAQDVDVTNSVALKLIEAYLAVEPGTEEIGYLSLRDHLDVPQAAFSAPEHQAYLRRFERVFSERHGISFTFTCPFLRKVVPLEHALEPGKPAAP